MIYNIIAPFLLAAVAVAMKCPSSDAKIHAGCEVEVQFQNSCDAVRYG